jgi:hypothetical protein
MSKFEIKERFGFNIVQHIWWKFIPGTTITIPWPKKEWITLPGQCRSCQIQNPCAHTNDPNDHYRPYLEKHVGKQGWDWDWRIQVGNSMWTPGYEDQDIQSDKVVIKFRKGKEKWASITTIMWT